MFSPKTIFYVLLAFLLVAGRILFGAPESRVPLNSSIKELPPKRTLSVTRPTAEHLAGTMEFQVSLKMRNFAKFEERVAAGERISQAEMEEKYLPLRADYDALLDWAMSQHFTVVSKDPMRLGLFLRGTVSQIQQALKTEFARVTLAEGTFTSAITAPSLPDNVARPVLGINGLQPHIRPQKMSVEPQAVSYNDPPYLVKEILAAYNAANLGYTGTGEKIAILIDTFPSDSDLTGFWSHNNISQSLSNIEKVQVVSGTLPAVEGEETLDVEWSSGIAPEAKIRVYATKDLSFVNIDKGLQRIINDLPNQPQLHQLSISLGLGEGYVSASQKNTDAQYFATIANYGVSIFVSSGDSGSNEGGTTQVSYFASDPSVTGVGGTSLTIYSSGAVSSETGWSGSGGGVSTFFTRPSWQAGSGLPTGTKRTVPDVALVADPYTGAYVYLNGGAKQIGGTSWSAPVWAGFSALINQARKQNGQSAVGLLNPKVYPLLGTANFRDITAGSNGAYSAKAAYDQVTGIGVPDVGALLQTLAGSGSSAPAITSFNPTTGAVSTDVSISGINLDRTTAVNFNGASASFTINSATAVTATVPNGATTGPISIVTTAGTTTSAASFTVVPASTNNNFSAAQAISGVSGHVTGSNLAATKETGEPDHAGNAGGKSVWYSWTAPADGTYTFATTGSSFDTLMGVYTGAVVSLLTKVASSDDAGTSTSSSVTFSATGGTTYYIAVDGYNGASGSVELQWAQNTAAPVINSFSPQSGTPGSTVLIAGANFLGATSVTFGNAAAGYTVDSNSQITATVPASAVTGAITVTTSAGSVTSSANFVVVAVTSNDNFANAAQISGASGNVSGNNASATKEAGEPNHASNSGGKSIWYAWTAPADGTFTFNTSGSSFDTTLAIYTGNSVNSLTTVASNDDMGASSTSSATFTATGGTVYHIAVDGYNGASGNTVVNWFKNNNAPVINSISPGSGPVGTNVVLSGVNFTGATLVKFAGVNATFTVDSDTQISTTVPAGAATGTVTVSSSVGTGTSAGQFKVTQGPGNDDFVDRTVLAGASMSVSASNVGASKETGEPNHAGNAGGRSVWWSWTAPSDGSFAISTQGSDFDTLLGIYTGTAVDALTSVASNDDDPGGGRTSYVTVDAKAGTTYQIAVDGLNGASGAVTLSIYPQGGSFALYSTHFETSDGFTAGQDLAGQGGWKSTGSGGNGITSGIAGMSGQEAYIGYFAPSAGDSDLSVWHPVSYIPTPTQPIVKFAVSMAVEDSANGNYDEFQWVLYNRSGHRLFSLDFNNYDLRVYYFLEGQTTANSTGKRFTNGVKYKVVITMDFARNRWSATMNGAALVTEKPIRTTNADLDFGNMDAVWQIYSTSAPGDNFMVFDDLSTTAQEDPKPRIAFQPQSRTVIAGDPVTLSVVATGQAPLGYQWARNGIAIAGARASSFTIPSAASSDAGSYSVTVSNTLGGVTSQAATLTVNAPPTITLQPLDVIAPAGSSALFRAEAAGSAPLSYQWKLNGNAIPNETSFVLTLRNVQPASSGTYSLTVANQFGSATSNGATLKVSASPASLRGIYNSVLHRDANDVAGSGYFTVTMGATGGFSGTVNLGANKWRLAGKFDAAGHWQGTIGKDSNGNAVIANLQLGLFGTQQITGTLSIGSTTIDISANRDPFDGVKNIAPQSAKRYTMVMHTAPGLPEGHGYATVTVDKRGKVRVAGRLGDYTAFSAGAAVDGSGAWPLFVSLYKTKGYLVGTINFRSLANTDLDGVAHWMKPATSSPALYPAGFEGDLNVAGSVYDAPKPAGPVVPLNGSHQGTMTLSGGDPGVSIQEKITLGPGSKVSVTNPTNAFTIRFTQTTGVFAGSFKPAGSGRALPFNGVVLQKSNSGFGVFSGATKTGRVELEATAP